MKTIVSQFAGMGPMGWAVCGFILAGGCATPPASKHAPRHAVLKAVYTAEAITIDGSLQEAVWSTAPAYALGRAYEDIAQGKELAEAGAVQLVWNDTHLYVAVRFDDSDIIAQGKEDELHHYGLGDVAELFLKPEEQTWYWELYATPAGKKSTLWFPGRGHLGLPSAIQYESGLEVAAENEGTVNHWEDRDSAWTAEMACRSRILPRAAKRSLPARNGESSWPATTTHAICRGMNSACAPPCQEQTTTSTKNMGFWSWSGRLMCRTQVVWPSTDTAECP